MAGMREEGSDPRIYLRQIWRYRWALVAVALGIPLLAYVASSLLPKTYEATATLQAPNQSQADRAAQLVQTRPAARAAARELDLAPDAADQLEGEIFAGLADPQANRDFSRGPQLFQITAQSDSSTRAAEVANAFANVEGVAELDSINAVVVERAAPSNAPISPEPLRNTAVAFVFSLLLAGGLAVVLTAFDRRLRDSEQLEWIIRAPLLATIPEHAFAVSPNGGHAAEPFQMLRTNLTYLNPDRSLSSVVVASPGEGDGSTTVATSLAIAYAEADLDVLLVDADLRKSSVATRLGIEARAGLEDVLAGGRSLDGAAVDLDVDTERGRLRALPAGAPPANPAALLSSEAMRSFLAATSDGVDLVVIDTPPLLAVGDAVPLLPQASGVLLVARLDSTERSAVYRARELIVGTGATLLGGVLTGVAAGPFDRDGYGYGYGADARNGADVRPRERANPVRRAFERVRRPRARTSGDSSPSPGRDA